MGRLSYPQGRALFHADVPSASAKLKGLFVLYFPDDFRKAQRFYCFIRTLAYKSTEDEPEDDFQVLDAAVSSLEVSPH